MWIPQSAVEKCWKLHLKAPLWQNVRSKFPIENWAEGPAIGSRFLVAHERKRGSHE